MKKSVLILALWTLPAQAEQLRISSNADWRGWFLPGDAVEVADGLLKPGFVRRDVNAVADAGQFAGGIRDAGSNPQDATKLIDGDLSTSWAPDALAPVEDWWIEVDLGRVVSARKIQLRFDAAGKALEFFKILTSDGEPFFNNANSVIPGSLRYNKSARYSFNQEYLIEIDFGLKPLKNIRIQADLATEGARLAELSVETVGDNLSLRLRERGGNVNIVSEVGSKTRELVESTGISQTLIDGDITTYWGTVHRGGSGTQAEQQFGQFEIDLGALFWVDRVRMLGDASGIAPGNGAGRHRGGAFNYLWYKFYVSDGSRAPDGSLRWELTGELPADNNNLQGIVHFEERFPLRKVRHLRLFFPMSDGFEAFNGRIGTTAEWQVFGEGFPAEVLIRSPIYDLGGLKNVTALEWVADAPTPARLEIRSRTGNLLEEQYTFYDKNGKEVTAARWDKLIPAFRGPVDTLRTAGADWSNWSRTYERSGQVFLSPGPRQYVQLEVLFLSEDPFTAAALDDIVLHFDAPLAERTRAEISPRQAPPGEMGLFTYYLRADLAGSSQGFDRVDLVSSAGARFRQARLNGAPVAASTEQVEGGFRLSLAEAVRRSALVEIDFESTLFLNQTRFDAFLSNSRLGEQVRQPVDAGDASEEVDSQVVYISLPTDDRLLDQLSLSSPLLTPNGDGIGDRLRIEFNLLKLLTPRPVEVAVYDLSGRRVRLLETLQGIAGHLSLEWDGRTESGDLVSPGLYLLRVRVDGDALTRTQSRLLSVAY